MVDLGQVSHGRYIIDLYDLYDLYDLAHVSYDLHGLGHGSWVGSVYCSRIPIPLHDLDLSGPIDS